FGGDGGEGGQGAELVAGVKQVGVVLGVDHAEPEAFGDAVDGGAGGGGAVALRDLIAVSGGHDVSSGAGGVVRWAGRPLVGTGAARVASAVSRGRSGRFGCRSPSARSRCPA